MQSIRSDESDTVKSEAIIFTMRGTRRGARRALPLALSVFTVGTVFGVVAHQTQIDLLNAALMSGLVYAGASQFVALSLWSIIPFPVLTIILTTLIVNLRHVLMSASLRPWFARVSRGKVLLSLFFMVDESWALTMGEFAEGKRDAAFLLGSGTLLFVAWVGSTLIGYLAGSWIQDPARWGLDFAITAVFVALLVGMWKGKSSALPWAVAAGVALLAARWLPGTWYIVLGGLAGSITGALTDAR